MRYTIENKLYFLLGSKCAYNNSKVKREIEREIVYYKLVDQHSWFSIFTVSHVHID